MISAILLAGLPFSTVQAEDAGAYLAAQVAAGQSDYAAAARYFERLVAEGETSPELLEAGLIAEIGRGALPAALPIAERLVNIEEPSKIAPLLLVAEPVKSGDFATAQARLDAAGEGWLIGPDLMRGWLLVGQGQMSEAMKAFDAALTEPGLESFAAYHKALALAMVGDFEGADALLSSEAGQKVLITRRGVLAHVQVLSQLERDADAIALIDKVFSNSVDAEIAALRGRLEAGEVLDFTLVNDAREGVAELYHSIGSALVGEMPEGFSLLFSRIASWLRPDLSDAALVSAALLESLGQHDLAIAAYAEVLPESPAFASAEIGRAEALIAADRSEAAIEVLENLTRTQGDQAGVWISLGDTLRREDRFPEAAKAYDKAIDLLGDPQPDDWFVWYARAIAEERSDQWDKAEVGFRKALELNPGQPSVLNYLGYSYVEKQENFDEALKMIEQAVAARPDAGYIVDSLGWALYRLGRYEEAVVHMERAVELEAVDPVVNDHLGDVYWAVGRKREAEFQWKRALSFGPGDDLEVERVRRKLELGLDKVLADEGAPPLRAE
jgi:tetratricopeptide (TPR) repeat protein